MFTPIIRHTDISFHFDNNIPQLILENIYVQFIAKLTASSLNIINENKFQMILNKSIFELKILKFQSMQETTKN